MGGDYKSCGKLTNTICPMTCKIGVKNNKYSGTCLIRHTKGPGKCVGLYRMSEYSGFNLGHRYTLGP